MPQTSKTILLAEDELLVREAARMGLEDANYTVLLASNGDEALGQMQFIDPEVKVMFVTGVIIDWEELGVARIIQKPYASGELLRRVEELLADSQHS